jgi:hypothetical protein
MRPNTFSNIREAIGDIYPGEHSELNIWPITADEFSRWFETFQARSSRKYEWEPSAIGVKIRCVFGRKGDTKYGLESLSIGDSMEIEIPERYSHRVRQAASWLRRHTGHVFSVKSIPSGVLVTRLADDEIVDGKVVKTQRQHNHKYPIEGLEPGEYVIITLEEQPQTTALRAYCSYHGKLLGREFKVKKEITEGRYTGHRITRTA